MRAGLHVHHVEHRSAFGSRSIDEMNAPSNLITICWFHHRMLHAELIGLEGEAPAALAWTRPAPMETASERHEALVGVDELPLDEGHEDWGLPNVWQPGVAGPKAVASEGAPL